MRVDDEARRPGKFTSRPYTVATDFRGKLQVCLKVSASDRSVRARQCQAEVQILKPGAADWQPVCAFTWQGNSKGVKAGWPTEGPAVRIASHDPLLDPRTGQRVGDTPFLPGAQVRVVADSPDLTYAIDIDELPSEPTTAR